MKRKDMTLIGTKGKGRALCEALHELHTIFFVEEDEDLFGGAIALVRDDVDDAKPDLNGRR
jgi:hypothetical protein